VAELIYDVTGTAGAIFFMTAAFVVMNFVCVTAQQAGSRMVFAFSRDQMLPLSHIWSVTSKRSDTPVRAVWLCTALCIVIGLVGIGSRTAVAAIFSICAICHNFAYCVPIAYKHIYGTFNRGPWHMGRASLAVDVVSIVWSAFLSVVLFFPPIRPVTPQNVSNLFCHRLSVSRDNSSPRNPLLCIPASAFPARFGKACFYIANSAPFPQMNYASLIIGSFLIISIGYWFIRGRHEYVGPRVHKRPTPDAAIPALDEKS
jgi:amino acid transporter